MQYTTNYSLKKPQYADEADIEIINDNTDDVDTLIHQNRTMVAPAFDNTKAYVTGDPVEYLGALYVFTSDKAAGAWDASKVEPTTAAEMGGGGASALADLDDVEITNPSTGQVLSFDDDDDVWKNQDLPDVSVTKEASGNPIEITNAAAAPMVKCVTEITGSQDLHGYDKPWVGGAGKNKLPLPAEQTVSGITLTYLPDGGIKLIGSPTADTIYFDCFAGAFDSTAYAGYRFKISYTQPINSIRFRISRSDRVSLQELYDNTIISDNGSDLYLALRVTSSAVIPSSGFIIYPMLISPSETDPTFEPYSNICPITAYTEGKIEVRGRNLFDKNDPDILTGRALNPNNGEPYTASAWSVSDYIEIAPLANYILSVQQTSTCAVAFYDSSKSYISGFSNFFVVRESPSNAKYLRFDYRTENINTVMLESGDTVHDYEPYTSTTHTTTYPSAIYRGSEDVVEGEVTTEWGMIASYAGETLPGEWISDRDEYAPGTTPTTGAQVAYALATPTTSPVTPTNLPIKSLSGYTHIESSTGDMEIEYITKGEQAIVDLIEASDHIYSTQEQAVGTWVDGKTLYEQTLYLASASISSGTSASMPSISGVETVMVVGGSCYDVNDQRYYPLPYIRYNDTESIKIQAHVVSGSLATLVFTNCSTAFSLKDISVVVRYTKSSSNNRSLSAPVTSQKSISEPLTDKTEEVPTEEEKTVEKPETEEETNETE